MEKMDVTTLALCAASALFGAALSYFVVSRSNSVIINTDHEKDKPKVSGPQIMLDGLIP